MSNWWKFAAFAALVALVLPFTGCDDGGDDIIIGGSGTTNPFFQPDNFNGSTVQSNDVGDDGRGFDQAGQGFNGDLQFFWNVSNGTAIVMFTENSGPGVALYASFFNGSSFTPPVELNGANGELEDVTAAPQGFKAMFLNSGGREGDALIAFTRQDDILQSAATDEDQNVRLWGTYFDVSGSGTAQNGTVKYGFETEATVIDFDNVANGGGNDDNVTTFGFVSDSLHCSHTFTDGTEGTDSGDATNFAYFAWRKGQSSGGTAEGARYHSIEFDLTQSGNAIPQQQSLGAGELGPAGGSFENADNVDAGFVVHNGHMLWRVQNLGTANEDAVVTDTVHEAGATTTVLFGEALTGDPDTINMPTPGNLYGGDHGLTSTYAFLTAAGYTDGTDGSRAGDTDLILVKLDDGATTVEASEIDAHTDNIDTTDGDGDLVVTRDGSEGWNADDGTGDANGAIIGSRINRTGQYLTVLWQQTSRDETDDDDGSGAQGAAADNLLLFARAVQTRRSSATRTLANSLTPVLQSPSEVASGDTGDTTDEDSVDNVEFQIELSNGWAVTNGGTQCDPGCNIQTDNLRMNWTYQQIAEFDSGGEDADDERILTNGIDVTLDTTGTAAPTAALADTNQVVVDTEDTDYGNKTSAQTVAVDSGEADGEVLVFFPKNGNNPGDDGAAGVFTERRLHVWRSTATDVVSSDAASNEQLFSGTVMVGTVSTNTDFGSNPNWSGSTIHVLWTEQEYGPNSQPRLAARSYDKTLDPTNTTLEDQFEADLDQAPTYIDNDFGGAIGNVTALREGGTLGVYFTEDGHIYISETSGAATAFQSSPDLVDNEEDETFTTFNVWTEPFCDQLGHSIPVWQKTDDNGNSRVHLRVHN